MFQTPLKGAIRAFDALRANLNFNMAVRAYLAGGNTMPAGVPTHPPIEEWKRLDYSTTMTRLYQVYESLVHDCVAEWLGDLAQLVRYPELPDEVRSTHRKGIGFVLQNLDGRRFDSLSPAAMVHDYNTALVDKVPYTLLAEAFVLHDRNLKLDELQAMLRGCGLSLSVADWFKSHRLSKHEVLQQIGHSSVEKGLAAFIDLRNEASHATKKVSELLGDEVLLAYVDFVEGLCKGVVEGMAKTCLEWHEKHGQWCRVGKVMSVNKHDKRICIAPVDNCTLSTGSPVFLVGNNYCVCATVQEIRLEDTPVNGCTVGATGKEVGLRFDVEIHKNAAIFVRVEAPVSTAASVPTPPEQINLGVDDSAADAEDDGSGTDEDLATSTEPTSS